jgi:hypothetical protein
MVKKMLSSGVPTLKKTPETPQNVNSFIVLGQEPYFA